MSIYMINPQVIQNIEIIAGYRLLDAKFAHKEILTNILIRWDRMFGNIVMIFIESNILLLFFKTESRKFGFNQIGKI